MTTQFTSHISNHSIFKNFLSKSTSSTVHPNSQLLAIRDNRDIYYCSNNIVRWCDITKSTKNYQLLQREVNFNGACAGGDVISTVMNSSGTLLGLIGDSYVEVVTLPSKQESKDVFLRNSSFKIDPKGHIKKAIWQSCVANDSMLVLLVDNTIKAYDLTKSLHTPQVEVRLNVEASSISFGSEVSLSGGLTLYVATTTGDIYAIYPFVPGACNLAITREQLDLAIEETELIMQLIHPKFPLSSTLNLAVVRQYEHYMHLKSSLGYTFNQVKEIRGVHTDKLEEFYIVSPFLWSIRRELQGPIAHMNESIDDIFNFGNSAMTFLAGVSTSEHSSTVSYFAQVSPLLMNCLPLRPPQVDKKYAKPKKGFGFVDLQDQAITQQQQELEFHKTELSKLDKLHSDVIEIGGDTGHFGKLDNVRFGLIVDNTVIVIEHPWTDKFAQQPEINSEYLLATIEHSPITSFAYIKDCLTDTGEYLIVITSDNLSIIAIVNNVPPVETVKVEKPKPQEKSQVKQDNPVLDELSQELSALKISPPINVSNDPSECLNQVNQTSINIINTSVQFTSMAIKLQSKIISNLESLKLQAVTVTNIAKKYTEQQKQQQVKQDRIDLLLSKQSKLNEKMKSIQGKLLDNLQTNSPSLPLSEAERTWFKEINSITEKLNTTDWDNLSKQVESIKQQQPKKQDHLKQLELQQRVSKLYTWLKQEDVMIKDIKEKLTNLAATAK
ncbi:Nucleoporin NUP82 [Spathaspora sp. JA1]|nr:Nucleoporin NUP82 [Spathaspora sp. JA1]